MRLGGKEIRWRYWWEFDFPRHWITRRWWLVFMFHLDSICIKKEVIWWAFFDGHLLSSFLTTYGMDYPNFRVFNSPCILMQTNKDLYICVVGFLWKKWGLWNACACYRNKKLCLVWLLCELNFLRLCGKAFPLEERDLKKKIHKRRKSLLTLVFPIRTQTCP